MSAVRLERQHSLPQGQPVFHTARGSMYPRLARLSPCAAVPHKGASEPAVDTCCLSPVWNTG